MKNNPTLKMEFAQQASTLEQQRQEFLNKPEEENEMEMYVNGVAEETVEKEDAKQDTQEKTEAESNTKNNGGMKMRFNEFRRKVAERAEAAKQKEEENNMNQENTQEQKESSIDKIKEAVKVEQNTKLGQSIRNAGKKAYGFTPATNNKLDSVVADLSNRARANEEEMMSNRILIKWLANEAGIELPDLETVREYAVDMVDAQEAEAAKIEKAKRETPEQQEERHTQERKVKRSFMDRAASKFNSYLEEAEAIMNEEEERRLRARQEVADYYDMSVDQVNDMDVKRHKNNMMKLKEQEMATDSKTEKEVVDVQEEQAPAQEEQAPAQEQPKEEGRRRRPLRFQNPLA